MMAMEKKMSIEELQQDTDALNEVKKSFSEYPLYFYSGAQMDLDTEKLAKLLQLAVKMYDIEFVMIDNLQKFVKDDAHVVQQISQTISILKDLANDLKIPILIISHIRKPEKGRRRVVMHDAKSSSTIYQDADVILALWNNKDTDKKDTDDEMIISVAKNRMGEGGADIAVEYQKDCATFIEWDNKKNNGKQIKKKMVETIEDDIKQ